MPIRMGNGIANPAVLYHSSPITDDSAPPPPSPSLAKQYPLLFAMVYQPHPQSHPPGDGGGEICGCCQCCFCESVFLGCSLLTASFIILLLYSML